MSMTNGQQTAYPTEQTEVLYEGSLPDAADQTDYIRSYVNEEASAELPFGRMLKQGTADKGALLMAAQADNLIGILVRSQAYAQTDELGTTGLKPKVTCNVLTKGRIMVKVADAVTPASPVRVNEVGGSFQTAASAGVTIDISANARFLTSAGAGELAELEFDMTGLVTNATADV